MGLFDDLIPAQKSGGPSGLFDDLIPARTPQATPAMPADRITSEVLPGVSPPLTAPVDSPLAALFGQQDVVAPPPLMSSGAAGVPAASVDMSSAAGDLRAGWLQLQQFGPGRQMMTGTRDILSGVRREAQAAAFGDEIGQIESQIAELEAALAAPRDRANRLDPQVRRDMQAQIAELAGRRNQLSLALGAGGEQASQAEAQREIVDGVTSFIPAALRVAELNRDINQIPMNPTAEAGFSEDATWGETGQALLDDPYGVIRTFGLRSLPASAPTIGAAVIGQLLGGPTGAAMAAGGATFQTEQAMSVANEMSGILQQSGIDATNPDALTAYMRENPGQFSEALRVAMVRAGIISVADAATAGLVGKIATATTGMRPLTRAGTTAVTGTVLEPLGEAAGEAAAEYATTGKVTPGNVMAEAIGGLAIGGPAAVAQTAAEAGRTPGRTLGREFGGMVDSTQFAPRPTYNSIARLFAPQQDGVARPPIPAKPVAPTADGVPAQDVPPEVRAPEPTPVSAAPYADEVEGKKAGEPEPVEEAKPQQVKLTPAQRDEVQAVFPGDFAPLVSEDGKSIAVTEEQAQGLISAISNTYDPENGIDVPTARRNSMMRLAGILQGAYPKPTPVQEPAQVQPTATTEDVPGVSEVDALLADGQTLEAIRDFYGNFDDEGSKAIMAEVNRRLMDSGENAGKTVPTETAAPVTLTQQKTTTVRQDPMEGPYTDLTFSNGQTARIAKLDGGASLGLPGWHRVDGDFGTAKSGSYLGETKAEAIARLTEQMAENKQPVEKVEKVQAKPAPSQEPVKKGERPVDDLGNPVPKMGGMVGVSPVDAKQQAAAKRQMEKARKEEAKAAPQVELDSLSEEIAQRDNQVAPNTPRQARERFDRDMQDLRAKIASLKQQYSLNDDDELTFTYTLRRPSGNTKYTIRTGADGEALEGFVKRMGSALPINLNNTAGTKEFPVRGQPKNKASAQTKFFDTGPGRRDRVGRKPPGKLSPSFLHYSITNRTSVYRSALEDAGIPDNAPIEDQIRAISTMIKDKFGITVRLPTMKVRRTNPFGRRVAQERLTITTREALDQLLNAYQNLEMMAAAMGLPAKALGLEINGKGITLDLVGVRRLRGALGMFSWNPKTGERVITIPGRSNSFAHEWGHALDHYLNQLVDKPTFKGMLTRNVDQKGMIPPLSPHRRVTDAFARMMWSMFGDMTQIKAMILNLQVTAAQFDPNGKPTPEAKRAQDFLNLMKSGKRLPKNLWSTLGNRYFESSQEFDDAVGGGGYFTDPAEMFARAFEAWMARKVGQLTEDPQAFLTKGNWAYEDGIDPRLRMTFPKDVDADQFDIAMSDLALAMAQTRALGLGDPAQARQDTAKVDPAAAFETPRLPGVLAREKEEMGRMVEAIRRNLRGTTWLARGESLGKGLRSMYQTFINTAGAALWAVSMRQKNPEARKAIRNIASKIAKLRPGSGEMVEMVYQEKVEMRAKAWVSRIDNALRRNFGISDLDEVTMRDLRDLLNGQKVPNATPNLIRAHKELRQVLNDIWYDLHRSKINVGYADDYLPHIYNAEKVDKDQAGFKRKAKQVYELLFQREVREADPEGQLADMNTLINVLSGATEGTAEGDRVNRNIFSEEDSGLIAEWKDLRKALKSAVKRLKAAQTDKAKARIRGEIAVLKQDLKVAHEKVLDMLSDRYSTYASDNWFNMMGVGQLNDHQSIGPTASFLKGRTLPKEAGHILRDFMDPDVVGMLMHYAFTAARRAEYSATFGPIEGEPKPDPNGKLKAMLQAARDAGASAEDITFVEQAVMAATGRMEVSTRAWATLRSYTFVWGTIALLPLAAFTSMTESTVAGFRTGRARDGLIALIENLRGIAQRDRRHTLQELARAVGLIAPHSMETLMENRMSADAMADMPSGAARTLQRFFVYNGLTPLTNFQRVMMIPVASQFILRMLRDNVHGRGGWGNRLRDVTSGKGKGGFADNELNELGIPPEVRADLLAWMESFDQGFPTMRDLFDGNGGMHRAGELYAAAVTRFVNETVQNPLKTDRAIQANHPDYAALYGIMSFIDGFQRNVLQRNILRGVKDDDSAGKKAAKATWNTGLMLAPFAVLLAGHFLSTTLREFLLNQEKWQEMDDDDELFEWLLERAFYRTGLTGRLDPIVQMAVGVRYERDLTTVTAGPYMSHILQNVMKISEIWLGRNSAKNNTSEYNAAQAFYQLAIEPALLTAITSVGPGGPLSIAISRAFMMSVGSYDASKGFAEMAVGEKGEKHRGPPPWWEFGD